MALSSDERAGLVVKTQSGFYTVQTDTGPIVCQLRGTLKQASKKTELCVIGDHVTIEVGADGQAPSRESRRVNGRYRGSSRPNTPVRQPSANRSSSPT